MPIARFLSYGKQSIDERDRKAVEDVLRGDWLTQGNTINRFESALAEYVGAEFAVVVSSGTAALHLAQLASGMSEGKTNLTSAMTFVASANAALYCRGDSALADIDPQTLCMNTEGLQKRLEDNPGIHTITPVHFGGLSADVKAIREALPDGVIIEDAAHALGGQDRDGTPVGACAYSDMSTFSFHPVKLITTGEGGAITTNNKDLYERMLQLRVHGITNREANLTIPEQAYDGEDLAPWYYEQLELGFNYRITDIQAALGLSQLNKLDGYIARRREISQRYDEAFANLECAQPTQSAPDDRARSAHHLYVLSFDFEKMGMTRTQVMKRLREQNIGTQVHYIPVYRQPFHKSKLGDVAAAFPHTEKYYAQALTIPLFPSMTDEEVEWVITCVRDVAQSS